MILLVLLIALAAWAAVATVVELRRDGYRRMPTDWNRVAERDVRQLPESTHTFR
jgi:hypothetical protein